MEGEKHRGKCAEIKKFFADSMLGRLALWMRVMGYDVAYEKAIEDHTLIKRALDEGRIILTRDTLLIPRRWVRGNSLFIESDHLSEQLRQVISVYGIEKEGFLTRCLRCNILLQRIPRDKAEGRVPPYVFETQKNFSTCRGCGRIYWAGTHRVEMLREVSRIREGFS
jgi:uncharacterized protein with PIN domain